MYDNGNFYVAWKISKRLHFCVLFVNISMDCRYSDVLLIKVLATRKLYFQNDHLHSYLGLGHHIEYGNILEYFGSLPISAEPLI